MKALIVDDEPLARRELRRLLAAHRSIQIVGEAGDIDEARGLIESLAPGVVFLDIQMPGGGGFDLLAQLDRVPRIIFTTAYDRYAVAAFDVNALDYLLKPIEPERLAAALDKLQAMPPAGEGAAHRDSSLGQLFVRDGPRCWFIPLRDVSVFSAEGNYVRIQWGQERPLLGRSLAALESKLDPQRFFRANRQQIINLEAIHSVELGVGGQLHVQLNDGREVQISRRQARQFRERTTV
jgi:two-component system LytT family response regulator